MPPKNTCAPLTFLSSVRVGVYTGVSTTSCPLASSSAASALSRRQLPQYIVPAPPVNERILIRYSLRSYLGRLERARAEQKVDDVAFVRLEPVELNRRNRTEIQPVDVHGIHEAPPKVRVIGDRAADKRRADRVDHPILRALDDGCERKHVFLARNRGVRGRAVHDRGQQELGAPILDHP